MRLGSDDLVMTTNQWLMVEACFEECLGDFGSGASYDTNTTLCVSDDGEGLTLTPTKVYIYKECPNTIACTTDGLDCAGTEIQISSNVESVETCQALCRDNEDCVASIFKPNNRSCSLKNETVGLPIIKADSILSKQFCHCLPVLDPGNGNMVCKDSKLSLGSHCTLSCHEGFIVSGDFTQVTCEFNNHSGSYFWSPDPNLMSCSESVGIIVGGKDRTSSYLKSVEVFSTNAGTCQGEKVPDYPFEVAGSVSGVIDGLGIVCGGATNAYIECTNIKNGGKVCDRNVEYVQTRGGTRWYDGPKTTECYYYDHKLTHMWLKAVDLKEARAYASSVALPTGELWILGGLGSKSVLGSTEIVGRHPITKAWYVKTGFRRLPQPLFGHCSVPLDENRISVIGGFLDGDYSAQVHTYHIKSKAWTLEGTHLNEPRYDHSCKMIHVRGEMQVLAAGGWNKNGPLNTTELMNVQSRIWTRRDNPVNLPDLEEHLDSWPSLRRSAVIFVGGSDSVIMVGGITCGVDNDLQRNCTQVNSAIKFAPDDLDSTLDKWEMMSTLRITTPRSSHTLFNLPKAVVCTNGN